MSAPVLSVEKLTKAYPGLVAVSDLSFALEPGSILGMVGPNGAGKTTTMRSIAGIIPVTHGRITVAGHDLANDPVAAKHHLAYVPDDPRLFDALTVWEHIQFAATVYRVADFEPFATQLLQRFELTEKRHALAQELSRGMRQKLAITCACLHRPRVFMLDEPMTGLDPRGIRTMKEMVRQSAADGAAVIVSSHLLALVEDLCTHLLVMDRGQVRFDGSVDDARSAFAGADGSSSLEDVFFRITEGSSGEPQATDAPAP